jgi:putative tricarboxylic transport membrane protein
MKTARILFVLCFVAFMVLLLLPGESPAQKFNPNGTEPIEFVVQAAAGGGSDLQARTMQAIIEKEKLGTHPLAVVNRVGGAGAIAYTYVSGKKGNPYLWATATTGFLQTPLLTKTVYNYKQFTPLCTLAFDDFLIVVRADSPYKTMKDLIDFARKNPGELKVGGTTAQSPDAIIVFQIERETGVKLNYIPFKGGGDVMVALLGGHVDMASANPGEALAQMEAKKVRVLGSSTVKRLEGAPDIPTLKEQGMNVIYRQFRSIAAPKDIPKEALRYYEELFRKLSESKPWKEKYIKENMLSPRYLNSAETFKFWEEETAWLAQIMKEMKLIK